MLARPFASVVDFVGADRHLTKGLERDRVARGA
jgi:hypothetical protein